MKTKLLLPILLLFAGIAMFSCVKEEYNMDTVTPTNWDPNGAAPLINSSLTLWNILEDYDSSEIFVEDGTHFLYLIYENEVFSQSAEELISIPNQNVNSSNSFTIPGGALASGATYTANYSVTYDFALPNGIILDSLRLKQGTLGFNISSNFNYPAVINLTIPNSTQDGLPFNHQINLSSGSGSYNLDLGNSCLVFDNSVVNNRLVIQYSITLTGNGNANNSPYDINMSESFTNMKFQSLFGYLGQNNFNLNNDTVSIEIFNSNVEGFINWEDPKIYLTINNSLGMPVRINLNTIQSVREIPPISTVTVTGPGIPIPWNIAYPSYAQIGQSLPSQIMLDKTNSNIDDALNISPQRVFALLDGQSNPAGNTVKNFVQDTSRFTVDAKVELPLYGTAHDFILQDTFDLSFGEDLSMVEWIMFRIYTNNGFPIDGSIQFYFCDSVYNRVDSLLNPFQQILQSALPGSAPDYIVTDHAEKLVETRIEKDRLSNLELTKHIIVRANLDTYSAGSQLVKIYSYYTLLVRVSAQVQFSFSTDDDF